MLMKWAVSDTSTLKTGKKVTRVLIKAAQGATAIVNELLVSIKMKQSYSELMLILVETNLSIVLSFVRSFSYQSISFLK